MVGEIKDVAVAVHLQNDSVVVRRLDVPERGVLGVLDGDDTVAGLEVVAGDLQALVVLAAVAQEPGAVVLLKDPL